MERINDFDLPQSHNGENVNSHHESLEQLAKVNPASLGVMETGAYHAAYDELKFTVDVFSASTLSAESRQFDAHRDHTYSAFIHGRL